MPRSAVTSARSLLSPSDGAISRCRCGIGNRKWPRRVLVCLLAGYTCWFLALMTAHALAGEFVSVWIKYVSTVDIGTWHFVAIGSLVGSLITLAPSYYLVRSVPTLGSLVDGNIHSIADSDESTFAEVCLEALTYLPTSASSSPSNATVPHRGLRWVGDHEGGASPIESPLPPPSAPPLPSVRPPPSTADPSGAPRVHSIRKLDQRPRVMEPAV